MRGTCPSRKVRGVRTGRKAKSHSPTADHREQDGATSSLPYSISPTSPPSMNAVPPLLSHPEAVSSANKLPRPPRHWLTLHPQVLRALGQEREDSDCLFIDLFQATTSMQQTSTCHSLPFLKWSLLFCVASFFLMGEASCTVLLRV